MTGLESPFFFSHSQIQPSDYQALFNTAKIHFEEERPLQAKPYLETLLEVRNLHHHPTIAANFEKQLGTISIPLCMCRAFNHVLITFPYYVSYTCICSHVSKGVAQTVELLKLAEVE